MEENYILYALVENLYINILVSIGPNMDFTFSLMTLILFYRFFIKITLFFQNADIKVIISENIKGTYFHQMNLFFSY